MSDEKTPMDVLNQEDIKIEKTVTEKNNKGTVYKTKAKSVVGNPGDPDYLKVSLSIETGDLEIFSHMPRDSIIEVTITATQVTLEEAAENKMKQKHL